MSPAPAARPLEVRHIAVLRALAECSPAAASAIAARARVVGWDSDGRAVAALLSVLEKRGLADLEQFACGVRVRHDAR